ncbi:MAG: hypothetical protein DI539_09390 [Flavobacterium psychrophilum]|jgi:hypothetical protein|nr:MAG: hypothetical protein DI539_09390 [Flavobacterium psychrophilum]
MLISHSKQFIFIHIFKVAGTSIESALERYNNESFRLSSMKDKFLLLLGIYPRVYGRSLTWGHQAAIEVRAMCPTNMFRTYFKFCFVRNPYDWMISLYFYMKNDPTHPDNDLQCEWTLKEYIIWHIENRAPQNFFVFDALGNKLVNFVGRYENLQTDFDKICDHLKIERIGLKKMNKSKHDHYAKYFDSELEELVYRGFKKDFELFGYSRLITNAETNLAIADDKV